MWCSRYILLSMSLLKLCTHFMDILPTVCWRHLYFYPKSFYHKARLVYFYTSSSAIVFLPLWQIGGNTSNFDYDHNVSSSGIELDVPCYVYNSCEECWEIAKKKEVTVCKLYVTLVNTLANQFSLPIHQFLNMLEWEQTKIKLDECQAKQTRCFNWWV